MNKNEIEDMLRARDGLTLVRYLVQFLTVVLMTSWLSSVGVPFALAMVAAFVHGIVFQIAWNKVDHRLFPRE